MSKSSITLIYIVTPVVSSVWIIISPARAAAAAFSGIIYYFVISDDEPVVIRERNPAYVEGVKFLREFDAVTEIKKRVLAELKDVILITIKEKAHEEAKALILIQEIERARPAKEAAEKAAAVEEAGPGATEARINVHLMVIRAHTKAVDSEAAVIRSRKSVHDAQQVFDRISDGYTALSFELQKKYPPTTDIGEPWDDNLGEDWGWGTFSVASPDYIRAIEGVYRIEQHAFKVREDAVYVQLRAQETLAADIQAFIEAQTVLAQEISKTALVVESVIAPMIEGVIIADAAPKVVQVGIFIGITWVALGGALGIAGAVLGVAWRLFRR